MNNEELDAIVEESATGTLYYMTADPSTVVPVQIGTISACSFGVIFTLILVSFWSHVRGYKCGFADCKSIVGDSGSDSE